MREFERIVSLAPSNTEILHALDAWDRVIATTSICDFPPEAREKPSVGGWTNPDVEKVKGHEPDLILASDELQDNAVERCEEEDLLVKQLKPARFHDVFNSIKAVGELVEREEEARALVERMNERVRSLSTSEGKGTRIYCEEWHEPPMVGGNWIPGLVELLGCDYIIDEGERSRKVSTDEVRDFDPEHVFIHYCGFGDSATTDHVLDREGWKDITAVREENVHVLDDSCLNRPSPRLLEGMEFIRKKIT